MSEVGLEEFTHLFGAMTDGFDRMCKALNVSDKLTIDEVVNEVAALTRRVSELEAALNEVRQVSCGEMQVADDDTEGMEWIYRRLSALLAPLPAPVPAQPETPGIVVNSTRIPGLLYTEIEPMSDEEYQALWYTVASGEATDAQWTAYRAEVERRKRMSDATKSGRDERGGRK